MKYILSFLFFNFVIGNANAQKTPTTPTYRVSIAFGSIGTGVPSDKPLASFIDCFKTCNKIKEITATRIGPLGREGEYKLAFALIELNKIQKKNFVEELKKVAAKMKDRGYATVTENDIINLDDLGRATSEKRIF